MKSCKPSALAVLGSLTAHSAWFSEGPTEAIHQLQFYFGRVEM